MIQGEFALKRNVSQMIHGLILPVIKETEPKLYEVVELSFVSSSMQTT